MMEKEKETKKNEGEESVDQTINLVRSKWFGENLQMPKKKSTKISISQRSNTNVHKF